MGGWCRGLRQLLTIRSIFKHENNLVRAGTRPKDNIKMCQESLSDYVNVIRFLILKLGPMRATSTCPELESMRLQRERANAVLGYWRDGFKERMPSRDFNGEGWGIDLKSAASSSAGLSAESCVPWQSEYAYVGVHNNSKKLACTFAIRGRVRAPDAAAMAGSAPWHADAEVTADYDARRIRQHLRFLRVSHLSARRREFSWGRWQQVPQPRVRLHRVLWATVTSRVMTRTMTRTSGLRMAPSSVVSRKTGGGRMARANPTTRRAGRTKIIAVIF